MLRECHWSHLRLLSDNVQLEQDVEDAIEPTAKLELGGASPVNVLAIHFRRTSSKTVRAGYWWINRGGDTPGAIPQCGKTLFVADSPGVSRVAVEKPKALESFQSSHERSPCGACVHIPGRVHGRGGESNFRRLHPCSVQLVDELGAAFAAARKICALLS